MRVVFSLAALAMLLACPSGRGGETVPVDLDADGRADVSVPAEVLSGDEVPDGCPADRDDDGDLEWITPVSRWNAALLPDVDFHRVWDSGSTLSTIWTVVAGDADVDGVFDFAGGHFNPNVIHLFESDLPGSGDVGSRSSNLVVVD